MKLVDHTGIDSIKVVSFQNLLIITFITSFTNRNVIVMKEAASEKNSDDAQYIWIYL